MELIKTITFKLNTKFEVGDLIKLEYIDRQRNTINCQILSIVSIEFINGLDRISTYNIWINLTNGYVLRVPYDYMNPYETGPVYIRSPDMKKEKVVNTINDIDAYDWSNKVLTVEAFK